MHEVRAQAHLFYVVSLSDICLGFEVPVFQAEKPEVGSLYKGALSLLGRDGTVPPDENSEVSCLSKSLASHRYFGCHLQSSNKVRG